VTGYSDTDLVVEAIKAGADEFIVKPYRSRDLMLTIRKHLTARGPRGEASRSPAPETADLLVGDSAGLRTIRNQIRSYAAADETVLITGESEPERRSWPGPCTGLTPAAGPFHAVNCGAVPETLFESEMFGSDRGASRAPLRGRGSSKVPTAERFSSMK
jgi:two-component system C4-dicarboxylate transport response regulator DctD